MDSIDSPERDFWASRSATIAAQASTKIFMVLLQMQLEIGFVQFFWKESDDEGIEEHMCLVGLCCMWIGIKTTAQGWP